MWSSKNNAKIVKENVPKMMSGPIPFYKQTVFLPIVILLIIMLWLQFLPSHDSNSSSNSIKYENKITTHGDLSAVIANEVKSQMIELSQLKGADKSQYPPGMVHSLIRHLLTHSFIQYSKKYTRG
jgi:hypothetical protein